MSNPKFSGQVLVCLALLAGPASAWAGGAGGSFSYLVRQTIEHGRAVCRYERRDGRRSDYQLPRNESCPKKVNTDVMHPGWISGTEGHLIHSHSFAGTRTCVYRDDGQTLSITLNVLGAICPAFHTFFIKQAI